ncbi:hypothetical protein [Streptomyces venezuelae]
MLVAAEDEPRAVAQLKAGEGGDRGAVQGQADGLGGLVVGLQDVHAAVRVARHEGRPVPVGGHRPQGARCGDERGRGAGHRGRGAVAARQDGPAAAGVGVALRQRDRAEVLQWLGHL